MPETGTSGLMSGVWKRSRSCFRGTDGQDGPVTPTRLCTTAPHLDSTQHFEWMACFTLILLGLVCAPFYIKSRVSTLPEFMERRYCLEARTFLAVVGLLGALRILSLFAAAKLFEASWAFRCLPRSLFCRFSR